MTGFQGVKTVLKRIAGILLAMTLLLTGCSSSGSDSSSDNDNSEETIAADSVQTDQLQDKLSDLVDSLGDEVQITVMTSDGVVSAGEVSESTAWSTIKVPISIAALQQDSSSSSTTPSEVNEQSSEQSSASFTATPRRPWEDDHRGDSPQTEGQSDPGNYYQQASTEQNVELAITQSDNDAASALFDSLGSGYQPSLTVDNVLRAGGDSNTYTLPNAAIDPDSSFGMTQWSAEDQVNFASWLACSDDSSAQTVYSLMSQITPEQQFGMAGLSGYHVKSGWGTNDTTGASTMRQMAILEQGTGYIAISVIVVGDDPDEVESEINDIADWVSENRSDLPVLSC